MEKVLLAHSKVNVPIKLTRNNKLIWAYKIEKIKKKYEFDISKMAQKKVNYSMPWLNYASKKLNHKKEPPLVKKLGEFKKELIDGILEIPHTSSKKEQGWCEAKDISNNSTITKCKSMHNKIKCQLDNDCQWNVKDKHTGFCDLKNKYTDYTNVQRNNCRIRHNKKKCILDDMCEWEEFGEITKKKNCYN